MNLPETTHIFIVHPFWFEDPRRHFEALAAEKQGSDMILISGIARAYRLGLKHKLTTVRFIVRDTIEEEIHNSRMKNIELELQ